MNFLDFGGQTLKDKATVTSCSSNYCFKLDVSGKPWGIFFLFGTNKTDQLK